MGCSTDRSKAVVQVLVLLFVVLWFVVYSRRRFVSSPEHEVHMVSYCGQSMSVVVVRRAASTIALKAYSSYTPGPTDLILGIGSIGVTCRSKIAKIVPIGHGRHGSHLENLFFASSPEPKGQLTPNLLGSIGVTCRFKIAKIVPIGNPRWPPWRPS